MTTLAQNWYQQGVEEGIEKEIKKWIEKGKIERINEGKIKDKQEILIRQLSKNLD